jgi:2-polyprenyl-3-methyl-5-hydroxy-6-metoxy-1,4-benzoquinol methylase
VPQITRESQYQVLLNHREVKGTTRLGVMNNQVWHSDPRRLAFTLARYKFVSKMFSGRRNCLEVGCGDAFASRIVKQEVSKLTVVDFDPVFIADIENRADPDWPMRTAVYDALSGPPTGGPYDAIYSLDVLEHIDASNENRFLANLVAGLDAKGAMIIGMPSLESQTYASAQSKVGHVNCKSGVELKRVLHQYFHNVFLFSMNDEVVHTGFSPMAHYLLTLCTMPR